MANFLKPPGIDLRGYDRNLNRQTIHVNHYATVALWGGGAGGERLQVVLNDPSIGRIEERRPQGDLRIFRVTGMRAGNAMLEARNSQGAVWAFMQIRVTGSDADNATKKVMVNLDMQVLEAYLGSERIFFFECVTGDSDHPTDPGVFHVFRKDAMHYSHTYHVPMHYALFFTSDGKAIHQYHGVVPLSIVRSMKSGVSDWFGSHGCVRLTEDDARALFEWAPIGTRVEVR